jgi:prepilin-type N-terminal cleavage/methylation domain-containing protein
MKIAKTDQKGFTLIEVIVTLVLVGITAALAGMWIVSVVNGYIFTKMNADTVQKAQLAMTRLTMEFTRIKTVDTISAEQITYTRTGPSGYVSGIVKKNGNLLELQLANSPADPALSSPTTLTDSVNSFVLTSCDEANSTSCLSTWTSTSRIIEITITLMGANNTTSAFTKRITPRYL